MYERYVFWSYYIAEYIIVLKEVGGLKVMMINFTQSVNVDIHLTIIKHINYFQDLNWM